MPASLSAVARHFLFVRETEGPNRGAFVDFFQRFTDGRPGDPWCCDFESFVESIAYDGRPPTLRTGSCADKLADADAKGFRVLEPAVDDLYFFLDATGHAHHVGIVTATAPLAGIAGNTSADGSSVNGDGVYEHAIAAGPSTVFVRPR
jgi:hypothetical protein